MSLGGDLLEQARKAGYEHGVSAGSWVIDGNTSAETARWYVRGFEDGDPEVYDSLPSAPLSGEWADAPTPSSVLTELAGSSAWDGRFTDDEASELLDAYEDGFYSGVEDEVSRSARAIL